MPANVTFVHGDDQERMDHTPGSALAMGDVVVFANCIGIVTNPQGIAANALGSLATNGVFEFTKDSGDTFAVGAPVSWDASGFKVEAPGSGLKPIGYAEAAGVSGKTRVWVRINKPLLGATP